MAGFATESATARLARLLTMVPWLVNRQGIDLRQAADDLGVSVEQLEADLNLLFLCGYGQMPDELIEADWEEGRVFVGNADTIARPLRLGVDEAVTLIVGLRALREVPGLGDRDAVERALAKLEDAAGSAAAPAARVRAEVADGGSSQVLARVRQAVTDRRRVHLRYLVPARDEATERDVDPMRVVGMDGRWYLEGWCHRAGDTRMFRLDRIEELTVLDLDGTPPAHARERDLSEGTFRPAPDDLKNGLSKSEVERLGVVTEVKGAKVGGQRVKEAWRWGMRGNLARIGTDIQCQWTFTYDARTFVMRVTARKDGWDKFKADAADIFKSFRILEEPK